MRALLACSDQLLAEALMLRSRSPDVLRDLGHIGLGVDGDFRRERIVPAAEGAADDLVAMRLPGGVFELMGSYFVTRVFEKCQILTTS